MIRWREIAALLAALIMLALLVLVTGMLTGAMGELWDAVRAPLLVLGAMVGAAPLSAALMASTRMRARRARQLTRYQLVLAQSDEATHGEVAAACEHLVQLLRVTLTERVRTGQPWLAIESWHVPSSCAGETGSAMLMVLCEPSLLDPALAALRRAFPNLTVRQDATCATARRYDGLRFAAEHVLRVHKARDWVLPIGGATSHPEASNARSVMAAVVRQQQQEVGRKGFASCVRWCLDLGAPAFGLTPLHVEPGWSKARLPDELVRIAGLVVHCLLDLFSRPDLPELRGHHRARRDRDDGDRLV